MTLILVSVWHASRGGDQFLITSTSSVVLRIRSTSPRLTDHRSARSLITAQPSQATISLRIDL